MLATVRAYVELLLDGNPPGDLSQPPAILALDGVLRAVERGSHESARPVVLNGRETRP